MSPVFTVPRGERVNRDLVSSKERSLHKLFIDESPLSAGPPMLNFPLRFAYIRALALH
jgi:hypothetical protein